MGNAVYVAVVDPHQTRERTVDASVKLYGTAIALTSKTTGPKHDLNQTDGI